ncbi:MAG TPA: exodeoxyribonuclease VII large subunit [Gammaproteobacteria bacterium]|nr:exodeoxyribonuclease VII large subunit [Gammaproteobacteria bacterium]
MVTTQGSLELDSPQRRILTVSQLNREARVLLEGGFPLIWVAGEISNLSRPPSGHVYFSLKDSAAQVRCAMFRARAGLLRFQVTDGLQVLVRARVGLYEARGDFQLVVEHMEEAGHGALQRAFEELKQKLAREGLFDAAHKLPLPAVPRVIGVITSPTGAAIRDILSVIRRRYALARVVVYPVPVQGEGAAGKIAGMIRMAAARAECDVLILARGGGSLEDLWAFNEEVVARAIHACTIPVVSGVGHEIDFTIADFVADLRAPTPTGAAELVTPDSDAWRRTLDDSGRRLLHAVGEHLAGLRERIAWCQERLKQLHPARMLRERAQRLDELDLRLHQSLRSGLQARGARLDSLRARLHQHSPAQALGVLHSRGHALAQRLHFAALRHLAQVRNRLDIAVHTLNSVSPLATLERGYAIVSDAMSGTVIASVRQARAGQNIHARFADGRISAQVHAVTKASTK